MTDIYRPFDQLEDTSPAHPAERPQSSSAEAQTRPRDGVRTVLWLLLLVSAAANTITSSIGMNVLVSVGFGLATLGLITALVVRHRRGVQA